MQASVRFGSALKVVFDLWLQATFAPSNAFNGWSLEDRNPQVIQQLMPMLDWLYYDYFRAQTSGWENVPSSGKLLLIGSHNGGLAAPDMYMIMHDWYQRFGVDRPTYALMDSTIWKAMPGLGRLATQMGALRTHPKMARAALRRDATLLIYPGGAQDVFRPYSERHKIYFHGRRGFIKLALQTETPIVPVISWGAHSSLIVLADFYPQIQKLHQQGLPWLFGIDPEVFPVYLGLPWGIAFGPLPNIPFPVQVHTRVCPPIVFKRYGHKAAQDTDYVDECYRHVKTSMQQALDQLRQDVSSCVQQRSW